MVLGRVIGWSFLILAIIAAGSDLWGLYDTGIYQAAAIGELWQRIAPGSLTALRKPLEGVGSGWFWDHFMVDMLNFPAALSLAVLALIVIFLFRRRERRRH